LVDEKPTSAWSEIVPPAKGIWCPTAGFQPAIFPPKVAKRNTDAPMFVPSVTVKSVDFPVPHDRLIDVEDLPGRAAAGDVHLE
jgi:hypothetical protein